MRIYSALAARLISTIPQTNAPKPHFVYEGNEGDESVAVFAISSNGSLKPLEPSLHSALARPNANPACDRGEVLLVGGEYTSVCNPAELGGGAVYLYPILSSAKLEAVSVSYLNDVESVAL
jgi:hypothetical protein